VTKKNIAIIGSTGSLGTQALDVIRQNPDLFGVTVLTARSNSDLLIKQALEFSPLFVVIDDESKYPEIKNALAHTGIKVLCGIHELS